MSDPRDVPARQGADETGWGMFDDERVYDQPCWHEMRLGSHSMYCQNKEVGARKCYYRFTSAKRHQECEGFKPNPNDKSDWKDRVEE